MSRKQSIAPHSKEWFAARAGKFTASGFGKLLTNPKVEGEDFSAFALEYIQGKAREKISGRLPKSLHSKPTKWGNKMEASALKALAKNTGLELKVAGFLSHPTVEEAGATPDGILLDENGKEVALAEVKCPYNPKIHLKYCRIESAQDLKKIAAKYYWQIQGQLWIYGFETCYFASFDPRRLDEKRLFVLRVDRNEKDITRLEKSVLLAIAKRDELINQVTQQGGKQRKPNFFQRLFQTTPEQ